MAVPTFYRRIQASRRLTGSEPTGEWTWLVDKPTDRTIQPMQGTATALREAFYAAGDTIRPGIGAVVAEALDRDGLKADFDTRLLRAFAVAP